RDFRDETREIAPQVAAVDAVLVDTTSMSVEEVVEHLSAVVRERKTN
ncbi:MAG: (d)CMP kinase, partial [Bdellovibrionales bacterium]|nr:(d)CMP kinase [Bdellovibrionales bacterium]